MYNNKTKKEVWDDWSEWYVLNEVTKDNIDDFYKKDIKYFISRIQASAEFKAIKEPKKLQGKIDNVWETINVGEVRN